MQLPCALLLLSLTACGGVYTLDEQEGVAAGREAFQAHGNIFVSSTRELGPIRIDEIALELTFTVDAWSLADKVGFEYVSEGDPDFAASSIDLGGIDQVAMLQAAVDLALEAEAGVRILVLRTWSHETAGLATDQMTNHIDAWLTQHGL